MTKLQERLREQPPLSCPHIDRFLSAANVPQELKDELEAIKSINSQLRYGLFHERARADAAEAEIARLKERESELCTVCAELCQVIGNLADHGGVFDHPDVIKALDNASDQALTHKDLLPFPSTPLAQPPAVGEDVVEAAAKQLDERVDDYVKLSRSCGFGYEGPTYDRAAQNFREAASIVRSFKTIRTKDAG